MSFIVWLPLAGKGLGLQPVLGVRLFHERTACNDVCPVSVARCAFSHKITGVGCGEGGREGGRNLRSICALFPAGRMLGLVTENGGPLSLR